MTSHVCTTTTMIWYETNMAPGGPRDGFLRVLTPYAGSFKVFIGKYHYIQKNVTCGNIVILHCVLFAHKRLTHTKCALHLSNYLTPCVEPQSMWQVWHDRSSYHFWCRSTLTHDSAFIYRLQLNIHSVCWCINL